MESAIFHENFADISSDFAFGRNCGSFAGTITESEIRGAAACLAKLLRRSELEGASFFDIGCGPGLSMLAAKRLGAARVRGIGFGADSVRTAETLLTRYLPSENWIVRQKNVLDLSPERDGHHDIVYSWGALSHTGDMWRAIEKAAALVKPGGLLALAIYRKTPLCGFWRWEKRVYAKSSPALCAAIRLSYKALYVSGLAAAGRNPRAYIRAFSSNRGTDWHHDVHDWLGGYPYESASAREVTVFLDRAGFSTVRSFEKRARLWGLLGTHCDEFAARRR